MMHIYTLTTSWNGKHTCSPFCDSKHYLFDNAVSTMDDIPIRLCPLNTACQSLMPRHHETHMQAALSLCRLTLCTSDRS